MATIHMDVESARNVSTSIGNSQAMLSDTVLNLHSKINGLVGSAWIAPSANEFQSEYQEWATAMRQLLEQLATLQQRLNMEIAEFEQTASKLA